MIAIAAMSRNRVIGSRGKLPWSLPEELRWFREATMNQVLLMGRRTFDGLPGGVLPGRRTLVASRVPSSLLNVTGVETVPDLSLFRPVDYETPGQRVFVAGGAEVYRQLLPRCDELWLTLVDVVIGDGDTFFPPFEGDFRKDRILRSGEGFVVQRYLRKA